MPDRPSRGGESRRRSLAIAGIVAGSGLVGYGLWAQPSDEEQIRERLDQLAAAIAVSGSEQNVAVRGLRIKRAFGEIFDPQIKANIPELGSQRQDRDRLVALASRAGAYFESLDVEFTEIEVQIDGTQLNARVSSVAVLTALRRSVARGEQDERDVVFQFFKHAEHGWQIRALRVGEQGAE